MDFARLWEQAKDLWARPTGKVIFGIIAVFLIGLASISIVVSRPKYATLGTFGSEDAPKVAQKLTESKIPFQQTGSGFTFQVKEDQLNAAKLLLAEVNLDPVSSIWSPDLWKNRVSWSDTDFDKRRLAMEQLESNLSRSIMALSVVERARVQITVPVKEPLFKADEKPPKAIVTILPKKGQKLTTSVVEGIMEFVAGAVEGLQATNVVVMDASTSRVVSNEAFQKKDSQQEQTQASSGLLQLQAQIHESLQQRLTQQLERVIGPGNVSVIVNTTINWEKVMSEALEYKGANGDKGVVLSSQVTTESSEGSASRSSQNPTGSVSNSEPGAPVYPGSTGSTSSPLSTEKNNQIFNYLVNQTKTVREKPSGGIEAISIGILVNSASKIAVDDTLKQKIESVVATAMGKQAQVQVEAMPFADDLLKQLEPGTPVSTTGTPNWLYWILGISLGLGGIALFFLATRPRRPVLEPVFAGPEAAMMGGIPVTEAEFPASQLISMVGESGAQQRTSGSGDEEMALQPEEDSAATDEFLEKIGVDPAKLRMKEKIEKIAKMQPDVVANLIRTWMAEE